VTVQAIDSRVVLTPSDLGTGTYIVSWRVISADSHPISGGSTFSVGAPSTQVVAPPSVDPDHGVQWVAAVAQALTYLGVLGAAGLTAFDLIVLAGRPAPGHARRRRSAGLLMVAGVLGAVLVVPLTALRQSGAAWTALADPGNWSGSPADGPWLSALLIAAGAAVSWWGAWRSGPRGAARGAAAMTTSR
jgi:copper transport protein